MASDIHPAALSPQALLAQCATRRTRRGGPGGQHRNKVETAVVLLHSRSGIQAEANERRSQAENLREALFRLRVNLALAVRTSPPPAPSALWQGRCRGGRVAINPGHDDFPALLSEALDTLAAVEGDIAVAAIRLDCTSTQLVKLLKLEPRALTQVNLQRTARGRKKLK